MGIRLCIGMVTSEVKVNHQILKGKMAEESVDLREARAKSSTSPAELEKLAVDENEDVRSAVAGNKNAPFAVLEALAKDKEAWVRMTVAGNVNTPVSVLEKLVEDKDEDVRRAGTENPNFAS